MQKIKIVGKSLLGEKKVEGRKKERKIMLRLVATTSASARTTFLRTHSARTDRFRRGLVSPPLDRGIQYPVRNMVNLTKFYHIQD